MPRTSNETTITALVADRAGLREVLDRVVVPGGIDAVEADLGLRADRALGVVVEDDGAVARCAL
ncbi:hypothetical protein [Ralstonia solanacearum]|nr:hypothetical protein [Ralstonia solanacearum]